MAHTAWVGHDSVDGTNKARLVQAEQLLQHYTLHNDASDELQQWLQRRVAEEARQVRREEAEKIGTHSSPPTVTTVSTKQKLLKVI